MKNWTISIKALFIILILLFIGTNILQILRCEYYRKKWLELEFIQHIHLIYPTKEAFVNNYKGQIAKINDSLLIAKSDDILKNVFFVRNQYTKSRDDFFGYELKFNRDGNLIGAGLHKP